MNREQGTALVEELASHGYVVVTVSHTYDAPEVEFPGGRVELGEHNLDSSPHIAVALRWADMRFVLDELEVLASGTNPDADQRPLPAGLPGSLDTAKIGMFGHSLGGATTVHIMANDNRVVAGIDLDGSIFPDDIDPLAAGPDKVSAEQALLASKVGNRPFMIMSSGGFGPDKGPMMASFWNNLTGWRRFVSLTRTTHFSYTDDEPLINQLAAAGRVASAAPWVGEIDADRAIAVERDYVRAFFDSWLGGEDNHLLDGPSADYPEAKFY
jgi:pimeloyl-ACP methyl ester carboxylesterase